MSNVKPVLKKILFVGYLLVCSEIILRVISSFSVIPDIEYLVYAKDRTQKSAVPGLTFEQAANTSGSLMGHKMIFNTRGHRSLELKTPKPANENRVYFMGTSIALGWGVGQEETYPNLTGALLNKKLSQKTGQSYVSINAGVANFNTVNELALFKHDLKTVKPDAVILQYYLRDAASGPQREDSEWIKSTYLGAFIYRQYLGLTASSEVSLADYFKNLHKDGEPNWEKTKHAISELKSICAALKLPLAVVIIPELRDPSPDAPYAEIFKTATTFFKKINLKILDPRDEIFKRLAKVPSRGWAHPADPHPNAEIHRIIAENIYIYLAKLFSKE